MSYTEICPGCKNVLTGRDTQPPRYCTFCGTDLYERRQKYGRVLAKKCTGCGGYYPVDSESSDFPEGDFCPNCRGILVIVEEVDARDEDEDEN